MMAMYTVHPSYRQIDSFMDNRPAIVKKYTVVFIIGQTKFAKHESAEIVYAD